MNLSRAFLRAHGNFSWPFLTGEESAIGGMRNILSKLVYHLYCSHREKESHSKAVL
jgi:hypothetical protein